MWFDLHEVVCNCIMWYLPSHDWFKLISHLCKNCQSFLVIRTMFNHYISRYLFVLVSVEIVFQVNISDSAFKSRSLTSFKCTKHETKQKSFVTPFELCTAELICYQHDFMIVISFFQRDLFHRQYPNYTDKLNVKINEPVRRNKNVLRPPKTRM